MQSGTRQKSTLDLEGHKLPLLVSLSGEIVNMKEDHVKIEGMTREIGVREIKGRKSVN